MGKVEFDPLNIRITDGELWCLIVGMEYCSGEDFDPLAIKLKAIQEEREKDNGKEKIGN